jgi:hypothetical protein
VNPSDLSFAPSAGLLSVALVWPGLWSHRLRDQACVAGRQGVDHARITFDPSTHKRPYDTLLIG